MMFAGTPTTLETVRATVAMLRFYRAFLASGPEYEKCKNPEFRHGEPMTRDQVRHRLRLLINTAINRKAGIPDVACRKQEGDYQVRLMRDAGRLVAITRHRVRIRQFETAEVRERFSHLLARDDD